MADIIVPLWKSFDGKKIFYFDRTNFANLNDGSLGNSNRDWWNFTLEYFDTMRVNKDGKAPNTPEAYIVLTENISNLLNNKPLDWGVIHFGHKMLEGIVDINDPIKTRRNFMAIGESQFTLGFGSQIAYVEFLCFVDEIVNATYGMSQIEIKKGIDHHKEIYGMLETLHKVGLPYLIVD